MASYADVYGGTSGNFYMIRNKARKNKLNQKEEHVAYRGKYVCFPCRHYAKSLDSAVRRENVYGYQMDFKLKLWTEKYPTCPNCRQSMDRVGPKFRPPLFKDTKGWKSSEELYRKDLCCFDYSDREICSGPHFFEKIKIKPVLRKHPPKTKREPETPRFFFTFGKTHFEYKLGSHLNFSDIILDPEDKKAFYSIINNLSIRQ